MSTKSIVVDNDVITDAKKIKHAEAMEKWLLGCVAAGDFINTDFLQETYHKKIDLAKAVAFWTEAATLGNPQAQCELAWCYAHGFVVPKNIEIALTWYKKSSEQDFFPAYLEIISLYFENEIIVNNIDSIVHFFRKAINIVYAKPQGCILGNAGYWHTDMFSYTIEREQSKRFHRHAEYMLWGISKGVENKIPEAIFFLAASFYYRGFIYDQHCHLNTENAKKWYTVAAEQDLIVAQYELAQIYYTEKDFQSAFKYFTLASRKPWSLAYIGLAMCYRNGYGVPLDLSMALKYYTFAAQKGNRFAAYTVGDFHQKGLGTEPNSAIAVEWYNKALPSVMAYYCLANCFWDGDGVSQDKAKAIEYYTIAARSYSDAKYNLAKIYQSGDFVQKNEKKAFLLFKEVETRESFYELAYCYLNGRGCQQDINKYKKLLYDSAHKGYDKAQFDLAECFFTGSHFPLDYAQAVKWYKYASQKGHIEAMRKLALCYENGIGIRKNSKKAKECNEKSQELLEENHIE